MATHGWSNRRPTQAYQSFFFSDEEAQSKRGGGEQEQRAIVKGRSFVDIVKGQQDKSFKQAVKVKEAEKLMKMSWDFRQGEQEWLGRCAVGVLKNFAEVSRVNQRLKDAGIAFSASYLGDKSILWCLDSVSHKEAFIFNRFMWEDSFSAMVRWSESVLPQSRLAWINCWGVPLSCWTPDFFKSLGWKVGEPLLVEEEVENRNRLDMGRLLALVPQSKPCSTSILVEVGLKSYLVKLEEDCIPVDFRWTEKLMGLIKCQTLAGLVMMPSVDFQKFQTKETGAMPILKTQQTGMEKATSSQYLQTGIPDSKAKSVLKEKRKLKATRKLKMIGVSAKGKNQWVGKSKKKISVGFFQNGNLNLDKRQSIVRGGTISSEESTSSSEDSLGISFFEDSLKVRGECSKRQANQVQIVNGGDGLSGGPPKPKKVSFPNLSISPDGSLSKDNGLELCVDLGLVEVSSSKVLSHNHLKPILEEGELVEAVDEETSISSEDGVEEERAREVDVVQISEPIEKVADSEEDTVASELRIPNLTSKKKGKLSNGSLIKHKMKTRNSGIIEEEVSKVMEVGNLLGLDFSGIEQEVSEVIASREAEDIARMENQERP